MRTPVLLLTLGFASSSACAQMMQEGAQPRRGMEDFVDDPVIASVDERAPTAEELKFFEAEIRPILISNCYGCHSKSASLAKGRLRLDTRDAVRRGGKTGPAVVPGDVDSSLLIRAVRGNDPDIQMPPEEQLSADDVKALERWVAMGAPDPRMEKPVAANAADASPGTAHRWSKTDIAEGRERHWAYQPVTETAPPKVDAAWSRSAIDAFVRSGMEEHALTPAAPADPRTLLRRASFDLTGLPPSDAALAAFEADPSPAAFAVAIDAMLESNAFGERWGRHWLDVARYAESSGKESNVYYPHAWRYRDYVVKSFNDDKPYDRFLTEQLAGDLLPASNDAERGENLVATGYLAIGTKSHNARGKPQFQMDLADEQLDAATQGMLGLTVACARCHDHKFDPITQRDYYAMAGIFLSTDTRYGTFAAQNNNHPADLLTLASASGLPLGPSMPRAQRALLSTAATRAEEMATGAQETIDKARAARAAGGQIPENLQQQIQRARAAQGTSNNIESLTKRYGEDGAPTAMNLVAMGAADRDRALNARVLDRGELDKPGEVVRRGFVELLALSDQPTIAKGSGRLELAQWITDEDNPLTARVWANRVWLHLFGEGLVPTPDNFGMSGQQPSHPALLDHLAARLVAHDWSTKQLIREIMLTRAYAMSSTFNSGNAEIDPDNTYLWRMPQKRLEAEAIRDSMLAAAGALIAGPRLGSPVAFAEGAARGPAQERLVGSLNGESEDHRSIYLPIVRDKIPESLEVFDFAESAYVMGARDVTNVPTQALFLMNSGEIIRLSDLFAKRVLAAGSTEIERINAVFRIALGRRPSSSEIAACRSFLDDFEKAARKDGRSTTRAATDDKANKQQQPSGQRARARARLEAMRNGKVGSAAAATASGELLAYSSLCQAIFLSGEFRTVD